MNKKEIKKGRHFRVLLSGIFNACRAILSYEKQRNVEDPRLQTSGMTLYFMKNRAFTLIELLVVVLIIGILSAIALPQYELAIEKSRAAEALTVLKSVREAEEVYHMANGTYTNNLELLDVHIPAETAYWKYNGVGQKAVIATRKPNKYLLFFRYAYNEESGGANKNTIACGYDMLSYAPDSEEAKHATRICKALGATGATSGGRLLLTF